MARLGDVCVKKVDTIKAAYKGNIDYIDISSVDNQCKEIKKIQSMAIEDAPSRAKQLVLPGDILVSTVRPNLNAVALITEDSDNILVASTGYCVLRCLPNADNKYVFYFCQSPTFVKKLVAQATGASYPAVTSSIVKECSIPLPVLDEQRRIAAVLDKVSELIAKRRTQLDKLDELVKSRFIEMFGDPVSNNLSIAQMPMTAVCDIIDGDRGKNYPTQDEFFDEGYCLFLNAKNVTPNGFDFEKCMFITKEKDELLRKGHLNRGDVVLTTRGTIGNLAFYDNTVPYENMRINSGMVILRMNHAIVSEIFFIEQFKMQLSLIKEKNASGTAQPQLPISTMNKIMMLIPPIDEQNQFAAFVEQTEKAKTTISHSLQELETLKKALMQEYFG